MIDSFIRKSKPQCYLIFFLSLLLTGSCEKQQTAYFPLQAGLTWHYQTNIKTVQGELKQKDIINNLGAKSPDDEQTFVRSSISGINSHYVQNETGIQLAYRSLPDRSKVKSKENLNTVFNYPLAVGTAWQDIVTTSLLKSYDLQAEDVTESIPVSVVIESIDDTMRVPAGKFSQCIRVVATGSKFIQKGRYAYQAAMNISVKNTRWYAAKAGLIKELQVESTDILQYAEGSYSKTLVKFLP